MVPDYGGITKTSCSAADFYDHLRSDNPKLFFLPKIAMLDYGRMYKNIKFPRRKGLKSTA